MIRFSAFFVMYILTIFVRIGKTFRLQCASPLRKETRRGLNRVFIEKSEIRSGPEDTIIVHFDEGDERCKHIRTILKLEVNDAIKMGVINVGSTDRAIVIDPLEASGITISMGKDKDLLPNSRPSVDMILAVPRPLRLERILPVVSCMGVGRLVLIGAAKVQQDYFGSHLFRRPEELRKLLVEGLSQASVDCMLPEVIVRKFFKKFLEDIDQLFPPAEYHRFIAHPPMPSDADQSQGSKGSGFEVSHRLSQFTDTSTVAGGKKKEKIVVAVGPEGGWEESEVKALLDKGFQILSLGDRILRTDMAVPVLLGLANEWIDVHAPRQPSSPPKNSAIQAVDTAASVAVATPEKKAAVHTITGGQPQQQQQQQQLSASAFPAVQKLSAAELDEVNYDDSSY